MSSFSTMSRKGRGSSRSGRNSWPRRSASWLPTMRLFYRGHGNGLLIWLARHIKGGPNRRLFARFPGPPWQMPLPTPSVRKLAYPGRQTIALCGDGGFTHARFGRLADDRCNGRRLWSRSSSTMNHSISSISKCRKRRGPVRRRFQEPEFRQGRRGHGRERHPHRRNRATLGKGSRWHSRIRAVPLCRRGW